MNRPTILVTGAAGKTGSAVVAQLRERAWPVRAVVRKRDARSERLERLGAETVVADLYDYEAMLAAARGTKRAYFCPPLGRNVLLGAATLAAVARDARLESIVGLSQWLASPSHPSYATRQHWLADRLFAMLPEVAVTTVNPGFFADAPYLSVVRYAAHLGVYPFPADGASRNAPPSVEDIARVSVAALVDPAPHAGKTYRPTGPELLSVDDVVAILSRVFGRRIVHVPLPMWMLYKAARMDGFDLDELSSMAHYFHELNAGTFAFNAPTSDVLDVTGHEPEPFETIVRRYAALPHLRRTPANALRAFAQFLTVPFRPGLDPRRYEATLRVTQPAAPQFDADNERWKFEHAMQNAARSRGAA